jgi:hypothetical protein
MLVLIDGNPEIEGLGCCEQAKPRFQPESRWN